MTAGQHLAAPDDVLQQVDHLLPQEAGVHPPALEGLSAKC